MKKEFKGVHVTKSFGKTRKENYIYLYVQQIVEYSFKICDETLTKTSDVLTVHLQILVYMLPCMKFNPE